MLNEKLIEIKKRGGFIKVFSKKDIFVFLDLNKFNEILKNLGKITYYKEFFIKEKEKFLEIELIERKYLPFVLNIIENTEIVKYFELINKICSILIIKENLKMKNSEYETFFEIFNEYKIFVDEINITIPEESEILSSIEDFIIKSDFILILYEKNLEEKIKKYLRDFGCIIKIDEIIVSKKFNKKLIFISFENFYNNKERILKEVFLE
ncbi:MAG: hypothetical protein H5U37_03060 [Caldisericia bacterium]|nr:hypothetical protein [Caldisericia bacterium]